MININKCVKNCVEKYGLEEKYAMYIAKTDNVLLNIQELRYKYDNANIGKNYPDWLTPEEHLKMCYSVVHNFYNSSFYFYNSFEDIAYDLFIETSLHLNICDNKSYLYNMIVCKVKTIIRDTMQEFKCYYTTYDWEDDFVTYSDEDVENDYKCIKYNACSDNITDGIELAMTIQSIKDESIRGILLLCGYFIANIEELLEPLIEFYNNTSSRIKSKIYEIGKDDKRFCDRINKEIDLTNNDSVTVGRILRIFGKRNKSYIQDFIVPCLREGGIMLV